MPKVTTERKTFSKILVAIDGLVDYAANIASDYDAQLIILHAFNFHEVMIICPSQRKLLIISIKKKNLQILIGHAGFGKNNCTYIWKHKESSTGFCYCDCIDFLWVILLFTE